MAYLESRSIVFSFHSAQAVPAAAAGGAFAGGSPFLPHIRKKEKMRYQKFNPYYKKFSI
jgi:hypothetical protein